MRDTWANTKDLFEPEYTVGEKYSVRTPKGFRYTVCQPANADGAATIFPQHVRRVSK